METELSKEGFNQGAGKSAVGDAASLHQREPFVYGWCETDHKDGFEIRTQFRMTDYLKDEPYASCVKAMLEKLGLPYPKPEEIFRGTNHDLLFLNSHGVVLRIGPTDVMDLLNPGILQPLGWLEDRGHMIEDVPLTIAIYPGIELVRNYYSLEGENKPRLIEGWDAFFGYIIGQRANDMSEHNKGIMRVLDDEGKEVAVPILLDMDNRFNGSSPGLSEKRAASLQKHEKSPISKSEVLSRTLQDVFNTVSNVEYWHRAFQQHQPLRQLFCEAFKTDVPDPVRRNAFWDKCAQVTKRPEHAVMPVWRPQKDADGKTIYSRELAHIPNLVLHRQWTDEEADKTVKLLRKTTAIKVAVEKPKAGFPMTVR